MEVELEPKDSKRSAPEPVEPPKAPPPPIHTPEVGAKLSVTLPGETTRATVVEVLDPRTLVVALDVMEPMAKSHSFHRGDRVVVVRRLGLGGIPFWEAQDKA